MSALLTPELLQKAFTMVLPSIEACAQAGITNKLAGTFIVLDPTSDTAEVIFEESLDLSHEKASKYNEIARSKAMVSFATRRPSREVQQTAPHLYEVEDTKWGGSVIRDELVIGFSGVQAVFDEMFAGWLADAIIALAREQMESIMKQEGVNFIGDHAA